MTTKTQRIQAFQKDLQEVLNKHGVEIAVMDYDGEAESEVCVSFGPTYEGDQEIEEEFEYFFSKMEPEAK